MKHFNPELKPNTGWSGSSGWARIPRFLWNGSSSRSWQVTRADFSLLQHRAAPSFLVGHWKCGKKLPFLSIWWHFLGVGCAVIPQNTWKRFWENISCFFLGWRWDLQCNNQNKEVKTTSVFLFFYEQGAALASSPFPAWSSSFFLW